MGVKPEFFAVMSGRRKTSPPCFKSLREEEERPKTVWAFSPNICGEAGRRKLHREVFKALGRRKSHEFRYVDSVREEEDAAVVIRTQGRRRGPI